MRSQAVHSDSWAAWSAPRRIAARYPMATYLILACAISWAWWIPMAVTGAVSRQGVGWPTHLPGLQLGPAIAAFAVTALADGKVGIADLTRRLLRWRVGWQWWAIVVATASLAIVGVVISALLGRSAPPAADFARYTGIGNVGLAAVIIIALVVNGLGEETGWRGLRPIVCYESGDL